MSRSEEIPENSMIGRRVGVYRLEEEVGRGGMGVVYRASRVDGEFDQTVAIKLIKRGMDTEQILKRFRRERQITAALDHPNISYFLSGGSTEDGLPYFVMEFITGQPLYQYCDGKKLNIRQRLELFRQICWAVAAAHEIKVIHRDLKPSNVLVKEGGKPKLLDFGIAKVLDPDFATTDFDPTATQMRVMTPEYASPEQISGEDIGPASDIYSLGVILYELLTGHRPYVLKRGARDEAARIIREELPTNPSGSLTREDSLVPANGMPPSVERAITSRGGSLESLRRELSGDLDRIVLKSLRKKPSERYRTAVDFSDDITNFLEGRPVNAEFFVATANVPRSTDKLSIAILPFRTLGAKTGDTDDEFFGIGLADALITRLSGVQRLVVRPTSSVLGLAESDPLNAGRSLDVDFILDGSLRIAGGRIRTSVQLLDVNRGSTQWAHAFDAATGDVLELEESLAKIVTEYLLPQLTAEEQNRLKKRGTELPSAYAAYMRGRYFWSKFTDEDLSRAVASFNESIEIDPQYAYPYIGLADYYVWAAIFGRIPSKEAMTKATAAAERALSIDPTLGEAYAALAFCVFLGGWNWGDAEYLVKRGLELAPNYAFGHECYSNFLTAQGRFPEGIAAIRRAEELEPMSPRAMVMTAWTLYQARQFDEAVAKARKAVAMQDMFPQGLLHLGNNLIAVGETEEAIEVLRKAAEMWKGSGLPRYMLAFARAAQGNLEAANTILEKLIAAAETSYVKPYFVAMCCVAVGKIDEAFSWFEKAAEDGNEWLIWIGTEPKLDPIRSDPRYRRLLARTNNPLAESASQHTTDAGAGPQRSIAVLPFRNIGTHDTASAEDEYLSLGLADAVTMRLSNLKKFLVRPTSSVLQFAGKDVDAFTAGRDLGVQYVVDGLIRRVGEKIRVTAQLLDVAEGSTRWAAGFSENYVDVLELEDSISEQVTKQLLPRLSGRDRLQLAKRGTNNPQAHDAYLQGRYFWNQFTLEAYPRALHFFELAVEFDPTYALAYVGLADYYTWACIHGLYPPRECYPSVREYAKKALGIDPGLAEAHAALGLYYSNTQQFAECEVHYRKAIELNPNYGLAHEWLSAVLVGTGRFEEGTKEILLAEELDPLSLRPKVLSAWTLYQARNYDLALSKARTLEKLNSELMQTHLQLSNILLELGRIEEALGAGRRAVELSSKSPVPIYVLCFALAAAGLEAEAQDVVGEWEDRAETVYVPPYFLGMANLALGRVDRALGYLNAGAEEQSAWALWYMTEPKLDRLRGDERFVRILESTGLPAVFRREE